MPNLELRVLPFGIGVALVAVLLAFSFPAVSQDSTSSAVAAPVVTDAQCSEKWGDSKANDTCQNESVTADGGLCRVEAECLAQLTSAQNNNNEPIQNTYYSTSISATLDQVANLYNCGGLLTIGSC